MKLKPEPLRKTFKPVSVYITDLKIIHDLIKEQAGSVKISSDKYDFLNWSDFIKNGSTINTISLVGINYEKKIDIRFEIRESYTSLDCSWSDKNIIAHTFIQLSKLIQANEIKRPLLFRHPLIIVYNVMLVLCAVIGYFVSPNYLYFSTSFVIFSLALISHPYINLKSSIIFKKETDNKRFFHRKKDDIIIAIFFGAFWLIIAILINHFSKY